jgi:integrase
MGEKKKFRDGIEQLQPEGRSVLPAEWLDLLYTWQFSNKTTSEFTTDASPDALEQHHGDRYFDDRKKLLSVTLGCLPNGVNSEDKKGLIFQSKEGTPLDPQNCYQRWFVPAVERAREKAEKERDNDAVKALDGLHMHDLRHTFGSWHIANGEDILYVSAQMGHSKPSITADIYSHLLEKRRPHAAARMDDFLFGRRP